MNNTTNQIQKQPHQFRQMSHDELENLFSSFALDSWSYSGAQSFSRNEKCFEKEYLYRERSKRSYSSVAGNAYHLALDKYFTFMMTGERTPIDHRVIEALETIEEREKVQKYFDKVKGTQYDVVDLERVMFEYIEMVSPDRWKLMKTAPTIAECMEKANKMAIQALHNFFKEIDLYLGSITEVLHVEMKFEEFITLNGVDIPLPCHGRSDLIVRTKDGKIVVIDHKTKRSFTDEKDIMLSSGKQAITYAIGTETATGLKVDECWFVENKLSKNRDGSEQLKLHKLVMDEDSRRLYEAQLYEPVKRMLSAISNPDYVYLMNDHDSFVDKAEMEEFWAKTMIAEVDEFAFIPSEKRDMMQRRLNKIRDASLKNINPKIIKNFKANASQFITYDLSNKNMSNQEKISHRLKSFGIPAQVAHTFEGYSSDTYLLDVGAGTKLSNVYGHRLDIANAIGVPSVRMDRDLFVYDEKSYFVVESSKKRTEDLVFDKSYQVDAKIPVGVNNFRETIFWDLANPSTPHALVCGATGSGKSVWLKSTIAFAPLAGVDEIIVLDPKYDPEFEDLGGCEIINDVVETEVRMSELVDEMNRRVKNKERDKMTLIVFDEFADAVSQSRAKFGKKSTLEQNLQLILQKGRSCGFRVIAATQRASTKIINGDAKVNFPVLICFKVPKAIDSIVVLDDEGAESLGGQGDGLINSPEYPNMQRFQGFYI